MSIDIIVPCYKAHGTLDRLLASIAMQTVASMCTVYLINDNPGDDYTEIYNRWSSLLNIEYYDNDENEGPGAARQTGLDIGDGDYIVFCDADDTLCTSHALKALLTAAIKEDADIVSGQFIEECDNNRFVTHGNDLVWVFAKMYKRRTIERFLVHFNNTRANEDTGFNTVLSKLTDRIVNIPQTVYEWHYSPNSITRLNNAAYTWSNGHVGYIENMIWAVKELKNRNINKEIIRDLAVSVLCRLYFMHEAIYQNSKNNVENSSVNIKIFYNEVIQPFVLDGVLPFAYIAEKYKEIAAQTLQQKEDAEIIHKVTFRDYLKNLGYYDDLVRSYK